MTPNTLLQFAFHLAGPASPDRIAAESATLTPADWTDLLAFLKKQGLAPPLYDRIIQLHYDQVLPPDFVAELRAIYLNNAVRNLYAQRQLSQILAALESNQIPVVLLKGAAFAFSIYQNPACRMMSDLDLLVHQDHLTRVTSIFETLGYQLSGTAWQGPGHHLPPFFRPASLFPVELHWQLTTPNRSTNLSPDLIWNTAQSGSCFAHACCQLSPALALFHVCQHAAYQHLFASSPRAIFDIDTLLRADPDQLDWPAFWGYAETTACLPGVAFLLQLTAQLLSTPLPTPALARILAVTLPKGIQQDVYEVMLSGEELPDTPPSGLGPAVGWGLRKAGKLWRSLFLTRHPSAAGPAAPAPGLRRAGHLLKDQLSAARNLFRVNPNQPKLKTNRRLRRWLKIS